MLINPLKSQTSRVACMQLRHVQPADPPVEGHGNNLGVVVLLGVLQVTVERCQVQGLAIEGVADAPANHSLCGSTVVQAASSSRTWRWL